VLAGGLDRVYPPEHVDLSEEICAHGALVSEMPLGWEPRGRDFPRRNRIVSGLAMGIVVVEAARKSGSLITSRFANEQGREVFAVPGSPLDPRAEGTNDLLRQGATLCTCGADVIDALAPTASGFAPLRTTLFEDVGNLPASEPLWDETDLFGDPAPPLSQEGLQLDEEAAPAIVPPVVQLAAPIDARSLEDRLADLLGPAPVGIDDLVRASGASAGEVLAILLDLELQGRATRRGNLVTS